MSIEIEKLLREYVEAASALGKATMAGDYKTANKNYMKLKKNFSVFKKNQLVADKVIEQLFQEDDAAVKTWASAHALGLNIRANDAVEILERYSEDRSIGVLSLNTEITLKEWKKKGHLKF